MNTHIPWWQHSARPFLAEALAHINAARTRNEPIDRCADLCQALHRTWNAWFEICKERGRLNVTEWEREWPDSKGLRELLTNGLTAEQSTSLCRHASVQSLAELGPLQDHDPPLLELIPAWARSGDTPDERALRESLLDKMAQMLFAVRSDIAGFEQTPRDPDAAWPHRDRAVSQAASDVIEQLFEILFEHPSHRLAVYGTLAPGERNEKQLAGLDGHWEPGSVAGKIVQQHGLLYFSWIPDRAPLPVQLFCSNQLGDRFARLDRFEGSGYRRILVPVTTEAGVRIANIYEAARH